MNPMPPSEIHGRAFALYREHREPKAALDLGEVARKLTQIRNRYISAAPVVRAYIDGFFQHDLGARPNRQSGDWPHFDLGAVLEAEIGILQMLKKEPGRPENIGVKRAGLLLLAWYHQQGLPVTNSYPDRKGIPRNADGSGVPRKRSAADRWLTAQLQGIDPAISDGAGAEIIKLFTKSR